jgi:hypothetical protein
MSFRIEGLPAEHFTELFELSADDLTARGTVRQIAGEHTAPCRVRLTDAEPGEEVVLVNYEHHAVESPYRMRFAIYVRKAKKLTTR